MATAMNTRPCTDGPAFPRVDRSVVTVEDAFGESDEKAFGLSKTIEERLEALEPMRQIACGYDPTTTRFLHVLEIVEFPVSER